MDERCKHIGNALVRREVVGMHLVRPASRRPDLKQPDGSVSGRCHSDALALLALSAAETSSHRTPSMAEWRRNPSFASGQLSRIQRRAATARKFSTICDMRHATCDVGVAVPEEAGVLARFWFPMWPSQDARVPPNCLTKSGARDT